MPQQIRPPIHLPGETWTRLIEDKTRGIGERILKRAEELFPDGIFPTTVQLKGRQKLQQYLRVTTDLSDFARLADPDYETKLRTGLLPYGDPGPQSPYWKNALSLPGKFKELSKEFMGLLTRYGEAA